jgi:peptidoglycan/LPS O-acetylase OafA/YrhL
VSDADQPMNRAGDSIRALDGLRGLAAMIVVLGHVSNASGLLDGVLGRGDGQLGVMIFFVLSGFLMGHLYLGTAPGARSIGRFLVRRLARVVPLYLVLVLASFLVIQLLPPGRQWVYPIKDLGDLLDHLALVRGTDVLWSVVVEIKFYLLVPLIWLLYARSPRATLLAIGAIITLIFLTHLPLGWPRLPGARFLAYLPYFLAGLVLARTVAPGVAAGDGGRWNLLFAAMLAGVVLLYPKVAAHWMPVDLGLWSNPLCLLVVGALLVASLRAPIADVVLGSRPFRFLGRVSYGVYLLHMPVLVNIDHFSRLDHKPVIYLIVTLALVLLLAQGAFVLIERPARDAINRWFDRRVHRPARQAG